MCPICNLEISIKNNNTHVPLMGLGKLSDGNRICSKCYLKLDKIDRAISGRTKNYTTNQIKEVFEKQQKSIDFVEDQLTIIGFDKNSAIWGRKELKELPNILSNNENIKGIVTGTYNGGGGILVATNIRLIFIDKGLVYGLKTEDFSIDKITSIQYESGLLFSTVKIMASGNIAKIENVDKSQGKTFSETVRQILAEPKNNNTSTTVIENKIDFVDQLERLAKLKEKGIITQDEFDNQKSKLLNI